MTTFNGYKVKAEVIPVIRKVFKKYGDIPKDSRMHDSDFLIFFLEKLCWIVKSLEHARIKDVTTDMVDKMHKTVSVLEKTELNAGWLHAKPNYIKGVHDKIKDYPVLKEEKMDTVEKEKARLAVKQREVNELEKKVKAIKHEVEKVRDKRKPMSDTNIADELF